MDADETHHPSLPITEPTNKDTDGRSRDNEVNQVSNDQGAGNDDNVSDPDTSNSSKVDQQSIPCQVSQTAASDSDDEHFGHGDSEKKRCAKNTQNDSIISSESNTSKVKI